jgi:Flp pilus assembly pilin Flp
MAEYILLVVLIAIVVLIAAKLLGQNIVPLYDLSAFL